MSFEKIKLDDAQIRSFAADHYGRPVQHVEPLTGGEWSQAFAIKYAGKDLVVRFGGYREDFLRDEFAARFKSPDLPIPQVLEVGQALGGHFAVSERAFGTFIDDLDKPAMQRTIPDLLQKMDAIRVADITGTHGFGMWDAEGNGTRDSWRDVLLEIGDEQANPRIAGWRKGLGSSPVGIRPFDRSYSRLAELSADLPPVRSLIHNDLMNYNVFVQDDRITAIFDWANAMYGDFLYDLAQLTFWGPIYKPLKGIDWEAAALAHYKSIGVEVPEFGRRLQCCMVRMGLDAMAYYGFKRDWTLLEPVAARTSDIAQQIK